MGTSHAVKKKIIFVISRMAIGGSQKSLVNALCALDYDQYDVTLYVRENKTELISELPSDVKVTVNTNKRRYEHTPYTLFLYILILFLGLIGKKSLANRLDNRSRNYIVKRKTNYEKKHYGEILNPEYDIAISYLQGYTCKFTYDCIKADKMICFYHNSTDALPDIHKEYLNRFDTIVVISEETKDFLSKRYPIINDRILVIKNLINIEDIRDKSKKKTINIENGIAYLCTCGRMSPEKGYDLAIDAASLLKKQKSNFRWFFVGDGPEVSKLKKETEEHNLSDNILFLGSQENPYPWIAQCDIYIQPSYEEAQGLTIMEAQILHKPIISTKTVGAKTIISDYQTGLLSDINAEALSEGIARLMDDKALCNRLTENTKQIDYQSYNHQIEKQWDKLLAE